MNMDVLSWTSQDPRSSALFSTNFGVFYRFTTDVNGHGVTTTTLWRAIRQNREDKVAKLEWSPNGGLGRAIIGKNSIPMADLVRPDGRDFGRSRNFTGPDGRVYTWKPNPSTGETLLYDPNGNVIAFVRNIRPTRYTLGDVYCELHFVGGAGSGTVLHPPLMDTVCVTAMLNRMVPTLNL